MAELVADRLSALLKQKGLSQKDLADKTGITPAAISRYANGERAPRAIMLAKIAKALDVEPVDLTGTTDEQEVDKAIQLIARNANALSDEQREDLIRAVINK